MEGEEARPEAANIPVKPKRSLLWLWILIAVIVLGGGAAVYAYRAPIKDLILGKSATSDQSVSDSSSTNSTSGVKIVDQGITWLNPRVKLADLGLFKGEAPADAEGEGYLGTDYYKVATTTDGGEIILAIAKTEMMGTFDDFHHFLKKNGIYYWLSEHSDQVGGGDNIYSRTNSDTNNTFVIKSLQLDKTFAKGQTTLTQDAAASRTDDFVQAASTGTKIDETKWGDLYLLKGDDIQISNGKAKVAQYYILRNDGVKIIYHPDASYRNDDGTLNVTWNNAANAGKKFTQIRTSGCGSGGGSFPLITDTSWQNSKIEVGSKGSSKIYTVPATSALADFAHQVYLMDEAGNKVSTEAMMADLGLILISDGYGNWSIYLNDTYLPQAECGKPVIYLYPEKTTGVSVKVGADIKLSDPLYEGGWQAIATPSGQISSAGKIYPYLFWEGTGWGKYPAISSGTIIQKSDAATTITNNLVAIGLNTKEIADFKDFWLPKMPNTPYVRLTWLVNDEMNKLAPLAVSPKPDSVIRVFLDFQGMQSKVAIAPQVLPRYNRNGFTLVEWGGLLIK